MRRDLEVIRAIGLGAIREVPEIEPLRLPRQYSTGRCKIHMVMVCEMAVAVALLALLMGGIDCG